LCILWFICLVNYLFIYLLIHLRESTDKGRCPLCLDKEDVKHILLDCLETRNWRTTFSNENGLNMNKEVYWKILRYTNKDHIGNLGRYLDKVKHGRFNKTKEV
jgi:hypothetical protein